MSIPQPIQDNEILVYSCVMSVLELGTMSVVVCSEGGTKRGVFRK
jgi:hypothetical protein